MLRLAHVALVATGLLNVAAGLTHAVYCAEHELALASRPLIGATVTMPLLCLQTAWCSWERYLFFVPVGCLVSGVLDLVFQVLL